MKYDSDTIFTTSNFNNLLIKLKNMPIKKISSKERKSITKKWFTIDEVRNAIFAVKRPLEWRPGQFVFNRASELYGDIFVRSIKHDPFYNDENINPFIEALTEALNKSN